MKKYSTIFFDLDGTLSYHDWNVYKNQCFQLLKNIMNEEFNFSNEVVENCCSKYFSMIYENRFNQTLTNKNLIQNKFMNDFNLTKDDVQIITNLFYKQMREFVKLEVIQYPALIDAIAHLKQKGVNLVLATNSYFPIEMVLQRLEWTGIDKECFSYICDWGEMGYSKPNKEFFSEIVKKNNLDEKNVLMVGNNISYDGCCMGIGIDCIILTENMSNDESNMKDYIKPQFMSNEEFANLVKQTY